MWDEMYEAFWDKLEHFCARLCRDESRALLTLRYTEGYNASELGEMLALDPDGLSCTDCALVTLDKALTSEDIVEKLHISDCACIRCTMAQEAAVSAVSTDVAQIKVTDAPGDREDADTVHRVGAQMTL